MSESNKNESGTAEGSDFGSDARFRRRVVYVTGIAILSVAAVSVLWRSTHLILLVFAGILLALFLCALTRWVRSLTGLGHGGSLAVVSAVLFAVSGLTGWFLADRISSQMGKMGKMLPDSFEKFREWVGQSPVFQNLNVQVPAAEELVPSGASLADNVGGLISMTLGLPATFLIILFIGFFLSAQPDLYRKGLIKLVPQRHRDRASEVVGEVGETLQWWLLGKVVTMFLIGIFISGGLALLGVPLPLALGLLAMLLTFIPNFGPIASAVLAVLLAFTVSPSVALYTLILFIAVQGVESYIITPLIQRRAVKLPPAVTITAQILMGTLAGALGLVLATPMAAAGLVMVKRLYVEDVLGEVQRGDGDAVESA